MGKKISGLVLAAALLAPISIARAAEIQHLYTNNMFAVASSNDGAGTFTSVVVTTQKGKGAGPDTISVFQSAPSGFSFLLGTLPKGAFKNSAKRASLDVDLADLVDVSGSGFPAAGVISIDWEATDIERTSGSTKIDLGGGSFANIVGTTTFTTANIDGSILGVDMGAPTGYLNRVHTSVIVHLNSP